MPEQLQTDHVLHDECGLGRIRKRIADSQDLVEVEFSDGYQVVSGGSLRCLVSRTALSKQIHSYAPEITAWAVRKADEQGRIQPDVRGKFAGHNVNYYDVARIPALIEELSHACEWNVSTLVIHSRYGAGRIAASGLSASPRTAPTRMVHFFSETAARCVDVRELRRLLPSTTLARRLGVNRKSFRKLAARCGVYPDFVSTGVRARDYYDEGRVEEIRNRRSVSERADRFHPGCLVLAQDGEVASVVGRDADGRVLLRYTEEPSQTRKAVVTGLQNLVSLRALARGERMSRYKLNRLLTAANVKPAYRSARTIYFEPSTAIERLRSCLHREEAAVTLGELSNRTGLSAAVLARKINLGCIRTIPRAAHAVDKQEAQRVGQLVQALQNAADSDLQSSGICRLKARGRNGQEIVSWDLSRLIEVAQPLPQPQRLALLDQVGWLCDGAGQKRFREAIDCYSASIQSCGTMCQQLPRAKDVLLALAKRLPQALTVDRSRIALLACGTTQIYRRVEQNLRLLAQAAGWEDESYDRFRVQLERKLAELLVAQQGHGILETVQGGTARGSVYPEDDMVPGAIIVLMTDGKPELGVILNVVQQSWNAATSGWEKQLVVRFADGERRINPYAGKSNLQRGNPQAPVVTLTHSFELGSLLRIIRSIQVGSGQSSPVNFDSLRRRAS